MGFTEPCFRDSVDDLIDRRWINPSMKGITRTGTEAKRRIRIRSEENCRLPRVALPRPAARSEFYSSALAAEGLEPLPAFRPPDESRRGADAHTFPFEFLPRKADNYMNSTFANLPGHRKMESPGLLMMHASDAGARRDPEADWVEIYNARGKMRLRARIDGSVPTGVVAASLSWNKLSTGGNNVNALTSERLTDLGRGATFYSTLVEVRKLSRGRSAKPLPSDRLRSTCLSVRLTMPFPAGFQCAGCGEWNEIVVDESAGGRQHYVEDCQVCCKPNLLSVSWDSSVGEFFACVSWRARAVSQLRRFWGISDRETAPTILDLPDWTSRMVSEVRNESSELGSTPSVTYNRLFLQQDPIFSSEGVPILRVVSGSLRSRFHQNQPALPFFFRMCRIVALAFILRFQSDPPGLSRTSSSRSGLSVTGAFPGRRCWRGCSPTQGDTYDPATIERDFNSLWNTGYFENLQIAREDTPKGIILDVIVKEKPTIREINYKGLNSVSTSDVLDRFKKEHVSLSVESPYDPTRLARAIDVIRALLAEHGHQFATVKPESRPFPPPRSRSTSSSRKAPP